MKSSLYAAAVALALAGVLPAVAQYPVSRPTGVVQTTIIGNNKFTAVGVPFTREPAGRVTVTSVSGTTVNVAETLTASAYQRSTAPHSVVVSSPKILSGGARGRVFQISNNGTGSLTLAVAPGANIVTDDELEIIPEWTLGNFFGTGSNPSGLVSNSDSNLADIVYLTDVPGTLNQYYHNGTNWLRTTGAPTNRNNLTLSGLSGGCLVQKKSVGNITLTNKGFLRSGTYITDLPQNFSFATFVDASGSTLGTSDLRDGSDATSLNSDTDSNIADIVILPDASGNLQNYYHNDTNWLRTTGAPTNRDTLAIPSANAVLINKKSSGTYLWKIEEKFQQ